MVTVEEELEKVKFGQTTLEEQTAALRIADLTSKALEKKKIEN